jgi:cyanate permease
MAFGVSVMQPAMPPLVRAWLPDRIGFGTAVYTNGLLVGEILPVALTLPLVLPLVAESWRLAFVVWAAPCALFAILILWRAPRAARGERRRALVAGLAQRPDLAPRADVRRQQRHLFRRQRLFPTICTTSAAPT